MLLRETMIHQALAWNGTFGNQITFGPICSLLLCIQTFQRGGTGVLVAGESIFISEKKIPIWYGVDSRDAILSKAIAKRSFSIWGKEERGHMLGAPQDKQWFHLFGMKECHIPFTAFLIPALITWCWCESFPCGLRKLNIWWIVNYNKPQLKRFVTKRPAPESLVPALAPSAFLIRLTVRNKT